MIALRNWQMFRCQLCRNSPAYGQNEIVMHLYGTHKVDVEEIPVSLFKMLYESDEVKQK